VLATLDQRAHEKLPGSFEQAGIGAMDRRSGEPRWTIWGLPPLSAATDDGVYAYSRAGLLVALDFDGGERWRRELPDDRSPVAARRGDRDSPFIGDVVARGGSLYVAAGREILRLSAHDGSVLGRTVVCRGKLHVVSRLAAAGGGLVATCTVRTAWDDEQAMSMPLWSSPAPLARRRIVAGDTVVLSESLEIRHRIPPLDASLAHLDHPVIPLHDGSVAVTGAQIVGEGGSRGLSIFDAWLCVLEVDTGRVRWLRPVESGAVAVAAGDRIFTGLAALAVVDGAELWKAPRNLTARDATTPPIFEGGELLFVDRGTIRSIDPCDGRNTEVIRLPPASCHGWATTNLAGQNGQLFVAFAQAGGPTTLFGIDLKRSE